MRRPRRLVLGTLLAAAVAVGAPSGTAASQETSASGPDRATVSAPAATSGAEQQRIRDYWTPARMRNAKDADAGISRKAAASAAKATVARGTAETVAGTPAGGSGGTAQRAAASVTSTTGKVYFTLGGGNYVCSGAATSSSNRSVVTTAGHCVNEGPGSFATNWAFVPAYNNGSRPYGTWTARTLVTTSAWANQGNINYDGGFAVMNTLSGRFLTDVVGGQGIAFNLARGLFYNAYGYPAAPPFDGETLQSCSGTASDDVWGGTQSQSIPCNMTGGSSGGPWLTGGSTINSVNSFGYTGVPNRMFGPYFGSTIQGAYNTAATS